MERIDALKPGAERVIARGANPTRTRPDPLECFVAPRLSRALRDVCRALDRTAP